MSTIQLDSEGGLLVEWRYCDSNPIPELDFEHANCSRAEPEKQRSFG